MSEPIKECIESIHTAISEIGKKLEEIRVLLDQRTPFKEDEQPISLPIISFTNNAESFDSGKCAVLTDSKKKKRKVLIGTPICTEKMYSWAKYVKAVKSLRVPDKDTIANIYIVSTVEDEKIERFVYDEGFSYAYIKGGGRPMDKLVKARNTIFEYALNNDYDYVLFIDSDVIVPIDTIVKLLDEKKDIIGGFYPITTEVGLPTPNAKYYVPGQKEYMDFPAEKIDNDFHQVDLIGMGCTLISRQIYLKYSFRCERGEYLDLERSEDMCFCEDLRKDRIPVYFDTGLICNHIISGNHWEPEEA